MIVNPMKRRTGPYLKTYDIDCLTHCKSRVACVEFTTRTYSRFWEVCSIDANQNAAAPIAVIETRSHSAAS
jgi:hypothetical protein